MIENTITMIEIDEKKLKNIQDFIADASFHYGGDSLDILEIVAAIKAGYRLQLPRYKRIIINENDAEPRRLKALLDTEDNRVYIRHMDLYLYKELGCTIEEVDDDS